MLRPSQRPLEGKRRNCHVPERPSQANSQAAGPVKGSVLDSGSRLPSETTSGMTQGEIA
jgi:hypothetical protein